MLTTGSLALRRLALPRSRAPPQVLAGAVVRVRTPAAPTSPGRRRAQAEGTSRNRFSWSSPLHAATPPESVAVPLTQQPPMDPVEAPGNKRPPAPSRAPAWLGCRYGDNRIGTVRRTRAR